MAAYLPWTADHRRIEPVPTGHTRRAPDPEKSRSEALFSLVNRGLILGAPGRERRTSHLQNDPHRLSRVMIEHRVALATR